LTLNLEKIRVLQLAQKTAMENPLCPTCGKHLKSMGKNQGFRCEKCHSKFPALRKQIVLEPRSLKVGLYVASTRSQRHLTKPNRRYGLEKCSEEFVKLVDEWHS
jgi:tRNA(Ile2)-agmatinylcytidine synthase